MVSKGHDGFVLWPHYFDADLSRANGRRVSEAIAVTRPDAAFIETAAKRLRLEPQIEEKVSHPSVPYERTGRVLVAKKGSKEAVIKMVAAKMHEMQAAQA